MVDANGMPTSYKQSVSPVKTSSTGQLTAACADGKVFDYAKACGALAVNTTQPAVPARAPPHL